MTCNGFPPPQKPLAQQPFGSQLFCSTSTLQDVYQFSDENCENKRVKSGSLNSADARSNNKTLSKKKKIPPPVLWLANEYRVRVTIGWSTPPPVLWLGRLATSTHPPCWEGQDSILRLYKFRKSVTLSVFLSGYIMFFFWLFDNLICLIVQNANPCWWVLCCYL